MPIGAGRGLQIEALPPITSGVPLPVVMVSPSLLLCVMEIPVSPDKLLHQLVALVLNGAAILRPEVCASCPFNCAICWSAS
jgi:hypothetical protein